jgi:hypothetical protein
MSEDSAAIAGSAGSPRPDGAAAPLRHFRRLARPRVAVCLLVAAAAVTTGGAVSASQGGLSSASSAVEQTVATPTTAPATTAATTTAPRSPDAPSATVSASDASAGSADTASVGVPADETPRGQAQYRRAADVDAGEPAAAPAGGVATIPSAPFTGWPTVTPQTSERVVGTPYPAPVHVEADPDIPCYSTEGSVVACDGSGPIPQP